MTAEWSSGPERGSSKYSRSVCRKSTILQVGNFLSSKGWSVGFIESLADRLEQNGWNVGRTSTIACRPLRLADMVLTILRRRRQFDIGHVTIFSGPAFVWAEAATLALRSIRKTYILSLH